MRFVVTVLFWAFFVPTLSFGDAIAILIWVVTLPFDRHQVLLHRFVTAWVFQYLTIWPGWSAVVLHRERIPRGPCVLVANHQSMADVVAVMGLAHQYKFVSKRELVWVPVVGWTMLMLRYVWVDRGRPHSMHRMVEHCRSWLKRGVPVLLFPEGTYTNDRRKLLPFKRGAFLLAIEEKVPVVPVFLRGTDELVFEDGPWMSPRASISIEVGEPINALPGEKDDAFAARVRGVFATTLGKLT